MIVNKITNSFLFLLLLNSTSLFSQKPVIKVDLNQGDRREAETNELGYTPWLVRNGVADSMTIEGVKITFAKAGQSGTGLTSEYYKAGIQTPYFARLASDGLTVMSGNDGAQIEMRISGLKSGPFTLLTFHNNVGGQPADNFAPLNIYVNGKLVKDKLVPTHRVKENYAAQTSYLSLNAKSGEDIVVLFAADTKSAAKIKNVMINGFEINTADPHTLAHFPVPVDGDEHMDAAKGNFNLSWAPAVNASFHEIYFGTDENAVKDADTKSPLFKGKQKQAGFPVKGLYSMSTYFWRVDEISKDGVRTKGDVWYFRPRQLAFKDAEGYGRFARGGRGGSVVEVTNLNDDGPGSLREAVTKNIGPRTIVFAVSGIITLNSRLVINQPYITIAGQTAPGKGICIRRAPLGIVADDAVIRNMRVRLGAGKTYDGMGITGANNSIVDHCSISWTIDESFSSRGAHNITLQRTLISEALNVAGHQNYPVGKAHGFAASIGGDVGSFHHNLLAHCSGRNWSLAGGVTGDGDYLGRMDLRNNVVYNWDTRTTDGGAKEVNLVNNYYKPGAATTYMYALNAQHEGYGGGMQRYFFDGNIMPGRFDEKNQEAGRTETGKKVDYQTYVNKPFFEPYVTTESARDAYKDVLSDVGCNQPAFDDHDIRMVHETLTGTYTYKGSKSGKPGLPDSQEDVGGWENYPELHRADNFDSDHDGLPDWWEKLQKLNIHSASGDFSDANSDTDKDGFTSLDEYLEWMATPHYTTGANQQIEIDLKKLTLGYANKAVFKVSNVVNGKVAGQPSNSGIVQFVPEKAGLSSFSFTVTDADGSSMTKSINVASGQM